MRKYKCVNNEKEVIAEGSLEEVIEKANEYDDKIEECFFVDDDTFTCYVRDYFYSVPRLLKEHSTETCQELYQWLILQWKDHLKDIILYHIKYEGSFYNLIYEVKE